jgi:hypothetical protein
MKCTTLKQASLNGKKIKEEGESALVSKGGQGVLVKAV